MLQFIAWSTSIVLLIIMFAPGNNIINWARAKIEISRQEKLIREYRMQIEMMEHKIDMLSSDRDTLEKFGREEFHMAAPGDDVYIIEDE